MSLLLLDTMLRSLAQVALLLELASHTDQSLTCLLMESPKNKKGKKWQNKSRPLIPREIVFQAELPCFCSGVKVDKEGSVRCHSLSCEYSVLSAAHKARAG